MPPILRSLPLRNASALLLSSLKCCCTRLLQLLIGSLCSGMSNLVKSLKQNIRNVKSQTSFNANSIFDTFFTVEKLDEEVRLLKVIEAVYGSRDQ